MLRYMTDRARPGLVALYDIRPGNGVDQFLQPRTGARTGLERDKKNIQTPTFYQKVEIFHILGPHSQPGAECGNILYRRFPKHFEDAGPTH